MAFNSPQQVSDQYSRGGAARVTQPVWQMLVKGIIAGAIIGLGGAVTNTAAYSLSSISAMRIACGLLFPFGLGMVMLLGVELFTGNMLLVIPVLDKRIRAAQMLKNLFYIYIGNLIGGLLVAMACVYTGQFNFGGGQLAVFTINLAATKAGLSFGSAFVMGILCNLLVCAGVLCALSAGDTAGRILGAYIPVSFFVICGFEHCVANMYYIPAGIFALQNPGYAQLANEAGIALEALNWSGFLVTNLIPVTLGNAVGGALLGVYMWACQGSRGKEG